MSQTSQAIRPTFDLFPAGGCQGQNGLAAIVGVRCAAHEPCGFEGGDVRAHRLRAHAFGAGEVGYGGGTVAI